MEIYTRQLSNDDHVDPLFTFYLVYGIINGFGLIIQLSLFAPCSDQKLDDSTIDQIKLFIYNKLACKLTLMYYIWVVILVIIDIAIGGVLMFSGMFLILFIVGIAGIVTILMDLCSLPAVLPQTVNGVNAAANQ